MAKQKNRFFMILAIIIITINMRSPIFSVSSLLPMISSHFDLTKFMSGLITTIPLAAFAIVSPFVPWIFRKIGMGYTMLAGFILIFAGMLIRSFAGLPGLYIGTGILGTGIAFCNVLMPVIIKTFFPDRIGFVTGVYSTTMPVFSGIAAAVNVPLAVGLGLGWNGALAFWCIFPILAVLCWLPQMKEASAIGSIGSEKSKRTAIWKSPMLLAITAYMGIQAIQCYAISTWLPTIAATNGFSETVAGYMGSFLQFASIPGAFLVPIMDAKFKKKSLVNTLFCFSYFIGFIGLWLFPKTLPLIYISLIFTGLGMGATFSIVLLFIARRTKTAQDATLLSGVSQSAGYLLAAVVPPIFGAIFDSTGSWALPLLILAALSLVIWLIGYYANKDIYMFHEHESSGGKESGDVAAE